MLKIVREFIVEKYSQLWKHIKHAYLKDDKILLLAQGASSTFFIRVGGAGLRMIIAVLLARILGSHGYGIFSYSVSLMVVLAISSMMGLEHVIIRYLPAYKEKQLWGEIKGLLRFAKTYAFIASCLVVFASLAIIFFFCKMEVDFRNTVYLTLFIVPIVVLVQVQQAVFRGLQYPGIGQIPEHLVYPIAFALFITIEFFLLHTNINAFNATLANLSGWVITFLMGRHFLIKRLPDKIHDSKAIYKRSLWAGMLPPLAFFTIAYQLFSRTPILILGILVEPSKVGIYAVSTRASEFIECIYGAMTIAGASLFSTIHSRGDKDILYQFTNRVVTIIFLVTLPIYLTLMLAAPWFLSLFGAEFVKGVTVMRILLTAFFLGSICGFVESKLSTMGYQRAVAVVVGVMAIVNIVLSFILIRKFGLIGAAIATGISVVLFKAILVVVLYRRTGIVALPFSKI